MCVYVRLTYSVYVPLAISKQTSHWQLGQRGRNITPADNKPRTGRDIARVTFDLYRLNPKDIFGSLSVKATFQGLYSVSADFQCLGPKKVLRWDRREL